MLVFFVIVLAVAVFSCARYYRAAAAGQVVAGIDVRFHLNSLQGVYDGLRGGQFPVKIWVNALEGYGYAAPLFYPNLFFYLPALLMLLGVGLVPAYCVFLTGIVMAAAGTMYLFAKKFLQSPALSLLAALLFVGGQYFYYDLFYRAGVSEALALIFIPVVLHGMYNMFFEGFDRPWILLLGVVAITYCHTITMVFTALFLIVVCLCSYKRFFFDKSWWKKVGILMVLYLLATSYFFLPFLEQLASGEFSFSSSGIYPAEYALSFTELFTSVSGLGIFTLLGLFLRLFLRKTAENAPRLKLIDGMLITLAILIFISSQYFPWKIFEKVLQLVQFPWRIYTIASAIAPVCLVLILRELFVSPKTFFAVNVILVGCMAIYNFSYLNIENEFVQPSYGYIGAGEWLPDTELKYQLIYDSDFSQEILDSAGNSVEYDRAENSVRFVFSAKTGESYTLPLLWYKGYTATVTLADGSIVQAECFASDMGLTCVTSPADGVICVDYTGTAVQTISGAVSVGALVLGAAYFILRRKRHESA